MSIPTPDPETLAACPDPTPAMLAELLPDFEDAWARYRAKGYHYGGDALENVAFGYQIALEELERVRPSATPAAVDVEVERLREALEPFAQAGRHVPDDQEDFKIIASVPGGYNAGAFSRMASSLTAGNFRRARATLTPRPDTAPVEPVADSGEREAGEEYTPEDERQDNDGRVWSQP